MRQPRATANPPLADILALDDATFRSRYAGTPVKRTGRNRVVRNALIAAGNSGDTALLPKIQSLLSDPSPLVRAMAVWAIRRLAPPEKIASLAVTHAHDADRDVREEWTRPL